MGMTEDKANYRTFYMPPHIEPDNCGNYVVTFEPTKCINEFVKEKTVMADIELGKMIDYSIKYLTAMRKSYLGDYEQLSIAIETMRKFQKIQEVMDSRPDDDAKSNSKALGEIEVIMYGNDT